MDSGYGINQNITDNAVDFINWLTMGQENFRNLVFEGGGVKGIAYGGALEVLKERG